MNELLIPVKKHKTLSGRFTLPGRIIVSSAHEADKLPLSQLENDLKKKGVRAIFEQVCPEAQISIRRNKSLIHCEGYLLSINSQNIEIISSTTAGAYYAIQTLRDLLHIHGSKLPCCRIEDEPTITRRGVYHDCSRGKVPTVSTVKELIECLAHWKINELQLYVENVFTFKKHPLIGRGYSPFTPKDILEIQAHCKLHHVKLVPSLASFGHMEKILCLPKYSRLGEMPGFRGLAGGTTLCPSDPGSIKLVADLFNEFLPLFDADDFNICGDEPWELGKGRSKSRAARKGIGGVYLDFILKIHGLCLKHGKRMNMWGDIVLAHPETIPQLPKDIVLLNWDYGLKGNRIHRTKEFTKAGLPLVCCPGTNGWQSHGTRLRQAIGNVSLFASVTADNNAEGFLNTDWGDSGHRNTLGVSLCSFAHGAAHAWHTKGVDDKKHIRNFTFHTFGDKKRQIAKALEILGGFNYENWTGSWTYHALTESLTSAKTLARGFAGGKAVIDNNNASMSKRIEKEIGCLKNLSWPTLKGFNKFETISMQEFGLAASMEILAKQRWLLAKSIRAGKKPSSKELKQHANGMRNMAENFARIWSLRNRPSRLCDNMAGFKTAWTEAEKLAKGK